MKESEGIEEHSSPVETMLLGAKHKTECRPERRSSGMIPRRIQPIPRSVVDVVPPLACDTHAQSMPAGIAVRRSVPKQVPQPKLFNGCLKGRDEIVGRPYREQTSTRASDKILQCPGIFMKWIWAVTKRGNKSSGPIPGHRHDMNDRGSSIHDCCSEPFADGAQGIDAVRKGDNQPAPAGCHRLNRGGDERIEECRLALVWTS